MIARRVTLGAFLRAAPRAVALVACAEGAGRSPARERVECTRYRPAEAKRTFDGRVGTLVVHNASARPAEVHVYHPDGDGTYPEATWTLGAGADSVLDGGFGNDWGLQVDRSCVATLGAVSRWTGDAFVVTWTADTLLAGRRQRPP